MTVLTLMRAKKLREKLASLSKHAKTHIHGKELLNIFGVERAMLDDFWQSFRFQSRPYRISVMRQAGVSVQTLTCRVVRSDNMLNGFPSVHPAIVWCRS